MFLRGPPTVSGKLPIRSRTAAGDITVSFPLKIGTELCQNRLDLTPVSRQMGLRHGQRPGLAYSPIQEESENACPRLQLIRKLELQKYDLFP